MASTYLYWIVAAMLIVALAVVLGAVTKGVWWGILVDERGRCSLTRLQVVLWTVIVLSLIAGVFMGRLLHHVHDPLDFKIPDNVLALLGISVGSAVAATAVKAVKNKTNDAGIAVSVMRSSTAAPDTGTRLGQIFLVEEGTGADEIVDMTKFQNFWFTVILAVAYVALAAHALHGYGKPAAVATLPDIHGQFIALLSISHGGYLVGKAAPRSGTAPNDGGTAPLSERPALIQRNLT